MRLGDIRRIRKKFGITQRELSKASGVSQSAIAKIESGSMKPSYEIAQKIFEALESFENIQSLKAKDILTKKVITVQSSDFVQAAINLMERYSISQIPVFDKGHLVGMISESTLIGRICEKNLAELKIGEIMEEAPPTISEDIPIKMVSDILKYTPIVLVYRREKLVGVITKSDLLKTVT